MTNLEKYDKVFTDILKVTKDQLPGLKYRGIRQWDSVGHMDLVSQLEETFDIRMSTLDVMKFSTYEKGKEILEDYGVDLE